MDELSDKEKFYDNYPGFDEIEEGTNKFAGSLKIKESYLHIHINLPKFPLIKDYTLFMFSGGEVINVESSRIDESWDVFKLFEEIPRLVNFSGDEDLDKFELIGKNSKSFFEELSSLESPQYRMIVAKDLSQVNFTNFVGYEDHFLEIKVSDEFNVKIAKHSLPNSCGELFKPSSNIKGYLSQFLKLLEQFEEFYANMNAIDELCFVVEPPTIDTKCTWRIFKLSRKVFIKILVNPMSPSAVTLKFIGPTDEVSKYREMYNERLDSWDVDLNIYRNLLRIFDMFCFPMRSDADEEEHCGICYSYMLENHVPIISCDNLRCTLVYHVTCIQRWLAQLKDGKTYLNVTLGSCPYCKEKLSTSFAQLLEL